MRGRKPGKPNVPLDKIQLILDMTLSGYSNPEISEKVGFSKRTIFKYQNIYLNK